MNTITESREQQIPTREEVFAKVRKALSENKVKSACSGFRWINKEETCVYSVNSDVDMSIIAVELLNCIANVAHMLQFKEGEILHAEGSNTTELRLHEIRLMLARLDQAEGLALSVANTIEDIEEKALTSK